MDIQDYIEKHKEDPGFRQVHFGLRCKDTACDTGPPAAAGPNYVRPGIGGSLSATEATREVAMDNWLAGPMLTAAVFLIAALIFRSLLVPGILMVILLVTLFAQYGLGGYLTLCRTGPGTWPSMSRWPCPLPWGWESTTASTCSHACGKKCAPAATTGPPRSAVLISVVILLSSFPLMNTHLANTWSVSLYIGLAFIIDVIAALTLLPLMVRRLKPRYVFGDG